MQSRVRAGRTDEVELRLHSEALGSDTMQSIVIELAGHIRLAHDLSEIGRLLIRLRLRHSNRHR